MRVKNCNSRGIKSVWMERVRGLSLRGDTRDVDGNLVKYEKFQKQKKGTNRMVLTDVLSCTTCFFRYNKSKQQGGFPCLQGKHFFFFCTFCFTVFFFSFLLSKWSKFPFKRAVKSKYSCIQLISIGALSFEQRVVLTDYRLPEMQKKSSSGQTKGVLLTYKKSSIASDILLLYYSHEILRLCIAAGKKKIEKKRNVTVDQGGTTSQHCHVVCGQLRERVVDAFF